MCDGRIERKFDVRRKTCLDALVGAKGAGIRRESRQTHTHTHISLQSSDRGSIHRADEGPPRLVTCNHPSW